MRNKGGPEKTGDLPAGPPLVHRAGISLVGPLLYHVRFLTQHHGSQSFTQWWGVPESSGSHGRVKMLLEVVAVFLWRLAKQGRKGGILKSPLPLFIFVLVFIKLYFRKMTHCPGYRLNNAELYEENHDFLFTLTIKKKKNMTSLSKGLIVLWLKN